ncbi:putative peptidyl-prolyl cis-trans isomerase [Diplonema papillatum]|nr:putative peptidyl-prolyl cis-trans isomerase [Diplonema papillatum]
MRGALALRAAASCGCRAVARRGFVAQHRWNSGRPGGFKKKVGWSDDPSDQEAAGSDPYERVNRPLRKKGSVLGREQDVSESPFNRRPFAEERGPTGEQGEHMFPVNPYYPRIADPASPEKARDVNLRSKLYRRIGFWGLLLLGGGVIGLWGVAIDALWVRPEKYQIPAAHYLMPSYKHELHVEHVVYLDIAINGEPMGKVHIGLFTNSAPYFCENFHRLATGNAQNGNTLKGTKFWKGPGPSLFGGDAKGIDGKDGLLAQDIGNLPEDKHNDFSFPFGCYAAGAFTHKAAEMNDSNFFVHMDEGRVAVKGDFTCFGLVLKGFHILETIHNLPKEPYPYFIDRIEVTDCGMSQLTGNDEAILMIIKKFHKARIKRFLATNVAHKAGHEAAMLDQGRKKMMHEKKVQVEEELRETRVNLQKELEAN